METGMATEMKDEDGGGHGALRDSGGQAILGGDIDIEV